MRPSRRSSTTFARPWAAGRFSVTVLLVALLGAAFTTQWMLGFLERDHLADPGWLRDALALSDDGIIAGDWWQFLTFGLIHAGPLHVIANGLILYFAGREVEPILGSRHLAGLFFGGNLMGGVIHWLLMPETPIVGTSPGVAAVVAAYATVLSEFEVSGNLLFAIPVRLRVKFIGLALLLFGAACWITDTLAAIGPTAICAGCVGGWLYARELGFGNSFWWERWRERRRQLKERLARMDAEQFVEEQVDPILEKIAREGLQSLTKAEKRMLEQGSAKFSERKSGK
jgi:membrane associated rhomboid family serine protease